ncbi:MAG: glycosyltransferase family protein [Flavobacteriales bacterium]|nr:glycosyltransferase family protein [Flavobacteriales bacterium]
MGSTRLPGKVLREVNGIPILQLLLQRLSASKLVDRFVVATTTNAEDDAIEAFCKKNNILCYRGSDWDVLERFYEAATSQGAGDEDHIVRICCDNPIHSYKVLDFVLKSYHQSGVDYFSNSNQEPDFLEDGFDVEVTSFKALKQAHQEAKLLSEREHVMPYIKNSGKFSLGWRKANPAYLFKLSVDTEKDLETVERIFSELKDRPDFSIDDVVDLLQRKPEILEINKESTINSGYQKSLREDRQVK